LTQIKHLWLIQFSPGVRSCSKTEVLEQLLSIIFVVAVMGLINIHSKIGFKKENLGRGILLGWLFLLWL
jgi:hypothetical protein